MAIEAARIVIPVETNAAQATRQMRQLEDAVEDTGDDVQRLGRNQRGANSQFSAFKNLGIAAVFTAIAVGAARLTRELITAGSDAEETGNKFRVVFRGIGDEAARAANELRDSYGLSNVESERLLSNTGDLLTGFGFTREAALDLSSEVNTLAVDLASFTNIEGGTARASEALTSALLGEAEQAKALGIIINQNSDRYRELFAETLANNDVTEAQAKALVALQIATEQSGNAIGDFERSQASFANQLRIAQANTEDLSVTLGSALLPLANVIVTQFNEASGSLEGAAGAVEDFITSSQGIDFIGTAFGAIGGTLAVLRDVGVEVFTPILQGVQDILGPVGDLTTEISGTTIVFDILGGVIQGVSGFTRVLTTAVREQVDFIIQFGRTVVETGELAVSALQAIFNRERREDLRRQAQEVNRAWVETGQDLVDVYAETFRQIQTEVTSFADGARDNAERFTETFRTAFDDLDNRVRNSILGANGPDLEDPLTSVFTPEALESINQGILETIEARIAREVAAEIAAQEEIRAARERTLEITRRVSDSAAGIFSNLIAIQLAGNQELTAEERRRVVAIYRLQQAANIAQVAVDTAAGISRQFSDFPFPVAIATSAIVAALGATQIGVILATPPPSFANGTPPMGFTPPPGTSDDTMISVSSQETVRVSRGGGQQEGGRAAVFLDSRQVGVAMNLLTDNNVFRPNTRALVTTR